LSTTGSGSATEELIDAPLTVVLSSEVAAELAR
jgi:hypothetical protein